MKATRWMLGALLPALASAAMAGEEDTKQDCVVLLHGLGRTTISMKRLEWSLAGRGYQVVNLSYPSIRLPVERLSREYLAPAVQRIEKRPNGRIHFVTHSLGGIVLRQYLAENGLTNIGRVVMLAPPNQGSEVADRLKDIWLYQCLTGPSGQELGTRAEDLPRRLGPMRCELGVIAGDRSLNPFSSRMLPGPDDGKVSVSRTRIDGMSDFVVMPASHTWLVCRQRVIDQVLSFLETGRFRSRGTVSLD